jgi:hypothetical protein
MNQLNLRVSNLNQALIVEIVNNTISTIDTSLCGINSTNCSKFIKLLIMSKNTSVTTIRFHPGIFINDKCVKLLSELLKTSITITELCWLN